MPDDQSARPPSDDHLSPEETELLRLLLCMTGREERLERKPLIQREQLAAIRAIWPKLRELGLPEPARCDLLNRLLLTLGIKPVSLAFFEMVFADVELAAFDRVRERIERFRILCMLEYGSFRYGYKQLRQGNLIRDKWPLHFPSHEQIAQHRSNLRDRLEPIGLIHIPGSQLFSLGYLASKHAPLINGARKKLLTIIDRAVGDRVADFSGLQAIAHELGITRFTSLIATAGIPGTEELVYPDLPLFGGRRKTMLDILHGLRDHCQTVDEHAIHAAQGYGLQNARTYMAMHDLDIYLATSMRDPLHFTTNWAFVQRLFQAGELAEWKLRYFDPTQAFLQDRIQKGLLECLMIKRARVTVYNAQEADTFGKDAEAGVTLAQRKPVIVYVARLFEHLTELRGMYQGIDAGARSERDAFVDHLAMEGLLSPNEKQALLGPERTKADAIGAVIRSQVPDVLNRLGDDKVAMELIRQGYDPERAGTALVPFAVERIQALEARALTFRETHPLSLQASPLDGVARGVIVTRTVEDTARVLQGIFLGTLAYEIVDDEENWLLVDVVTRSPVRVVTKDSVLTTAFWSENWTSA